MQTDFILRLIEGVAQAAARLMGKQTEQRDEEATRQAAQSFVNGLGAQTLISMDADFLVDLVLPEGTDETHRALLTAEAMLDLGRREPAHQRALAAKALAVVDAATSAVLTDEVERVGVLVLEEVQAQGFTSLQRPAMVRVAVASAQLSLAEDLAWEGLDEGEANALDLIEALLEVLDKLPEAELVRGGLTPEELQTARAELVAHRTG